MPTTPGWEGAKSGIPGDLNATNHASQVDQLLGTHTITPVYSGIRIVTPKGGENLSPLTSSSGASYDLAQPFTLPLGHTAIGRVTIPLQSFGAGANLLVSLCPDNGSGAPNTSAPVSSTLVPASWAANLGAPEGLTAAGPLAVPMFNTLYGSNILSSQPWTAPAGGPSGGGSQFASVTTSGNYLIMAGGFSGGAPAASVNTVQYLGGSVVANPMSQPALPKATWFGSIAATSGGSLVYVGGTTGTITSAVWVASWDENTGQVGTWSSQASLPVALQEAAATSYGNTVYVIGGLDSTATVTLNTVYTATVNNGQLTSWSTSQPLPIAVKEPLAGVIGNWLVVTGGSTTSGSVASNATYYAEINADGSLGGWLTGPILPTAMFSYGPGWDCVVTDSALITIGGFVSGGGGTNAIQTLTVGPTGLSDHWDTSTWLNSGVAMLGAFPAGNGLWQVVNTDIPSSVYRTYTLNPITTLSVPLCASGLTAGATYHVVLQQQPTASSADHIVFQTLDASPLPSDLLRSPRHANTWSVLAASYAIPISVYDNTPGGMLLHSWEDPRSTGSTTSSTLASRVSTMVYGQRNLPLGLCRGTNLPNDPLNSNPTFTSGTSPWTATNCTLTQSSAHVQGGFPFSGLMTPNGTSATVSVKSELVPVNSGTAVNGAAQWYQANGWVYSPTGYGNVSLSVNWYDRLGTLLSTSSNSVTVAAATWTNLVNNFVAPAGAAQASIVPTEGGTPAAGNTLFLSDVTLTRSMELTATLGDVTSLQYAQAGWPLTGVTQLA